MTEEQYKKCKEIINSHIVYMERLYFPYSPEYEYKHIEFIISLAKEVFNKDITEEEAKEIFNNACKLNNISSNLSVRHLYQFKVSNMFSSILNYFDNGTTYEQHEQMEASRKAAVNLEKKLEDLLKKLQKRTNGSF